MKILPNGPWYLPQRTGGALRSGVLRGSPPVHCQVLAPVALLYRGEQVTRARRQLQDLVDDLLAAAAEAGAVRSDVAPGELAGYCLHALVGAGSLPSEAARRRFLAVSMAGLRPQRAG